ncbi:uncharacterized protein LOC125868753 [Solanum stenotomum]|uniref:uncharacterized protein LOC125868753 n=1 Tax=Solanum stenotomum TaxID=172797 RepID=UPI0020CFF43C|nr:uncharacterized protein LOC125868753 [Solanum stenotomum]
MPVGYKPPKFNMFDGKGDPHAHLRAYCDKLVGVGRNEKLRMKLFIQSLSGEKKPPETFQEYARRWRTEAARVQPPLDESELSKYFIRAQEGIYFDKMMSMMGQKFAELVKMGDFIEEGVKCRKIQSMVALQAASRAIQSGSIGGIKRKERMFQLSLTNQEDHLTDTLIIPKLLRILHPSQSYAPRPCPNPEARNTRAYTPIVEPYAQLFESLRTAGVLQPVEGKLPDPIFRNFDGNKRCAYHSGIQGHDTEDCYGLKNQIESLIRRGVIKCTPTPPNVNNNPLPNHENREVNMVTLDDEYGTPDYPNIDEVDAMTSSAQSVITVQLREPLTVQTYRPRVVVTTLIAKKPEYDTKVVPWDYQESAKGKMIDTAVAQGMTRSGRCYAPEDLNQRVLEKEQNPKKNITDAEAAEFWKKMQSKDYSVEEQLKKMPAHISIWFFLMSSEAHMNALMEVLSRVIIPKETTSETLAPTIGRIVEANKISFHDDELLAEGAGHNKALQIAVKYCDKIVTRVLIDGGSGCNICPFTTLRDLGVNMGEIRESHVKVRDFDGAQKSVIGEIYLTLQVGPTEFPILFQVMDVSFNYNLFLGRSWVHMAKAVPSTLHKYVKFEWGRTEVTVHEELSHPIQSVNSIPVTNELDGATFHTLEIMQAIRVNEGAEPKDTKLSIAAKMVASKILKYGYQPKNGLGPMSNDIVEPIQLKHQRGTNRLGYEPASGISFDSRSSWH